MSVYARGRDYHKVMRNRLQKLSDQISQAMGPLGYRVFTDSAPVLEAELASRSGQGWRGKHTLLLNREAGSMFFLGEIFVDLALPPSEPVASHCGSCSACIDICPTQAIIAPYRLDARRCISYLTIEHAGPIPLELRPLMGNRIYGCDDCQLICPWNKFAQRSALPDFDARAGLAGSQLIELFGWSEEEFLRLTEGSPIRRIGHERWLRNIAVALGNALRVLDADFAGPLVTALESRAEHPSPLVREHVAWALGQRDLIGVQNTINRRFALPAQWLALAASSYWSTRNRQPPKPATALAMVRVLVQGSSGTKSSRIGLRTTTQKETVLVFSRSSHITTSRGDRQGWSPISGTPV